MRSLIRVGEALGIAGLQFGFCGGWGLELFLAARGSSLGRSHSDIDVAIRRDDVPRWGAFLGVMDLDAHEANVVVAGTDVELVASPIVGDDWVYRRDERVRLPLARAFVHGELPRLAPEIVLLFKAKNTRPKDEADFSIVAPHLDQLARVWLREAIATAHPGHVWLREL